MHIPTGIMPLTMSCCCWKSLSPAPEGPLVLVAAVLAGLPSVPCAGCSIHLRSSSWKGFFRLPGRTTTKPSWLHNSFSSTSFIFMTLAVVISTCAGPGTPVQVSNMKFGCLAWTNCHQISSLAAQVTPAALHMQAKECRDLVPRRCRVLSGVRSRKPPSLLLGSHRQGPALYAL